jgi:hypothetical protein
VRILEAVIFDFDAPQGASERDAHMFRDLIWSLHCADIRIAVTAADRRARIEPLVRELIGDGVVEVLITGDDVLRPKPDPEAYHRVLSELGLGVPAFTPHGRRAWRPSSSPLTRSAATTSPVPPRCSTGTTGPIRCQHRDVGGCTSGSGSTAVG